MAARCVPGCTQGLLLMLDDWACDSWAQKRAPGAFLACLLVSYWTQACLDCLDLVRPRFALPVVLTTLRHRIDQKRCESCALEPSSCWLVRLPPCSPLYACTRRRGRAVRVRTQCRKRPKESTIGWRHDSNACTLDCDPSAAADGRDRPASHAIEQTRRWREGSDACDA